MLRCYRMLDIEGERMSLLDGIHIIYINILNGICAPYVTILLYRNDDHVC